VGGNEVHLEHVFYEETQLTIEKNKTVVRVLKKG